jgi:type II secretory pathway pseudopilin PulG
MEMPLLNRWQRAGVTLLETIIVLCIIAGMLALLFPAVHRARVASQDGVCKNNLHQVALALQNLWQLRKKLPDPAPPNSAGGWAVAVLPFLEERTLADQLANNPSVSQPSVLSLARHRPGIMTCPFAWEGGSDVAGIPTSHYVFGADSARKYFSLHDASIDLRTAWVQSPEGILWALPPTAGPHDGGYFRAASDGRVEFVASSKN